MNAKVVARFSKRALAGTALLLACAVGALAAVNGPGPPVSVYETTFNGVTTGPTGSDPAHFNTTVWGSAAPPVGSLLANTSTYNGALINQLTTGNQFDGTQLWTCTAALFTYCTGTQAVGSTVGNNAQVFEFAIVQSWPFYVDSGAASNVNPGAFTAETTSDDGSWLVVGPSALTYAQPANFKGVTGLTAGTAVVSNSADQPPTSKTGTFTVARQSGCGDNLYWFTMEYDEAEGGDAQIEYSWQPPGSGALGRATQGVVYGQVRYTGTGTAGESVQVTDPNGGTHTLTTDASGCYGYNYAAFNGTQPVTITATESVHGSGSAASTVNLPIGGAVRQDFDFPPPNVQLIKRITQVKTLGPTPGPTTTPQTITPTPDPGSLAGVNGTANYSPGFYPKDVVTYTIYFRNIGGFPAQGAGGVGPTFSDVLANPLVYVASSQSFTCCASPVVTIAATFTQTGQTLKWAMAAPLPTPNPAGTAGPIQGNMNYQVTVP
ncbi:MAG TPA: hypothetical protein VKF82_09010 [Candidatus Eremiobacteraceae bacterium]|nr:hypothetical protein [Candidatus Eremiobacteraceae bacterium]